MKKIISLLIAVMMVFTLASVAMAEGEGGLLTAPAPGAVGGETGFIPERSEPLCIKGNYITGTVAYEGYVEVVLNGEGAGAGMNSVDVNYRNFPVATLAQIYVDGYLVDQFYVGMGEVVDPTATPDPTPKPEITVTIAEDGKTAQVTGDFEGLFCRVALALDMDGVSGLLVQPGVINEDGTVVIPSFDVNGLEVVGISVAVTGDKDTLLTPTPQDVLAHDFLKL